MTGSTDITFVLTSCGRFDLLVETRRAFLASNTAAISRYVIVKDSGDPQISDVFASFDVRFELLINDPPRGQMASIDPAYSGVHTPYIFHCEQWFKRNGMGIASLEWPACETTGYGRHVHDEFAPASWNTAIGSTPPLRAPPAESRNAGRADATSAAMA